MAIVSPDSLSLKYSYDPSVVTTNTACYTLENIHFTTSALLSSAKDIAINQDTLLVLTDNYNLNSRIDNFNEIRKTQIITKTTVSFVSGNTVMYAVAGSSGGNITFASDLSAATVFSLDFNTYANAVSLSSNGLYVTRSGSGNISMEVAAGSPSSSTQFFNYTLFNDQIVLLTRTGGEILTVDTTAKTLESIAYVNSSFTSNQLFKLNRFYFTVINNKGDSNLVKYTATPNDLTVSTSTSSLPYNYLITAPYQSLDFTLDYANINITPLKNYYSPEGIQTPTLSTQLKQYNKIYTGLNTEGGNDKIFLSYEGSEIVKTFAKDKDTYFHYPVSATNIALSASTLVKAGALGGSSPWRSDRLFVKKADYRNYSNWGDNPGTQNGTFFCTWLSARGFNEEPVWMDRYYNPSHVNLSSVLTTSAYTSSNNNYPNVIWDIPSNQTLNPESLYVYHRIGDEDNLTVVDTLSTTLTRHYTNWAESLINDVTGLSAGTVYNYSNSAVGTFPGTRYEYLDTSIAYAVTQLTEQELNTPGISISFNAYNLDWSNIKGTQLVGNYYNGGIGIGRNITLLTPFVTLTHSSIRTLNTKLSEIKTTAANYSGRNYVLKGEYDSSYYIVTNDKKIMVFDQDDLNTNTYNFTLNGTVIGANLIKEQGIDQILVFTSTGATNIQWKKFNTDGTDSTTGTTSGSTSSYNNYTLNLFGTPIYFNSLSGNGTVDSNNVVFALSGDRLVRDVGVSNTSVLSALSAEYVSCDHQDKLWLLYADRNLCKLDNYGNVIWDVSLTDAPTVSATANYPRIVNFISEINPIDGSIIHSGLVIDPKTQQVFKVDPANGNVVETTSLSADGFNAITLGDTTGYSYQRRYVYTLENSNDLSIKLFTRNITGNSNTQRTVTLSQDIAYLTPGWHHFAVTLNPNNVLTLYINGLSATSTAVGAASGIYRVYNNKNNSDLLIGTASFKNQTLADYTLETNDVYRFNGKIADVRFFTQALEQADIKALQKCFILDAFEDLKWSTPTGERYYIEQIERLFLHRLPGAKSNMFNIKIKSSNITNDSLRRMIEKNIIASLSKTIPVHTKLNSIIWE